MISEMVAATGQLTELEAAHFSHCQSVCDVLTAGAFTTYKADIC